MSDPKEALAVARPATPQQLLKADLEKVTPQLQSVLPKHVTVQRLIKVVLSATARNPKLLECSRPSILTSVLQGAELGLEIGGLLGEAYLVPYSKECKCLVGYKGLIKLAKQSGKVRSVSARAVYAKDTFVPNLSDDAKFEHVMFVNGDRGPMIAVWSEVRYNDGSRSIDVMTKSDVDKIRARSKNSGDSTPWGTDYPEMAKKTVVRRHLKLEDLSVELKQALEMDAELDREDAVPSGPGITIGDRAALEAELLADPPKTTPHDELTGEVT